jgi:hypothetical protein
MIKSIIMLLVFLGIIFIIVDVVKIKEGLVDREPKIIYRYIPKSFDEEQMEPVFASEIFETMFSQPSPWILSIREYDQRKQENINKYFVNQL